MSNRTISGERANRAWSQMKPSSGGGRGESGKPEKRAKSSPMPDIANPGNIVHCTVGGVHMGHTLAHENEAPFPLKLAEFFVKSFCPPGGVVCDVFSGSGTTCHAAFENGRRFVGCDLRQSQVELCARRMAGVTPSLFAA